MSGLKEFAKDQDYHLDIENIRETNKDELFNRVKPSDIRTLLDNQFDSGKPLGLTTGLSVLDPIFRWRRRGGLYGVSAYPQAGKSELTKYLSVLAAGRYDYKTVLFSPEEETDDIIEDLVRTYLGKNPNRNFKHRCTRDEYNRALDWVEKYYTILEYDGMVDFQTLINEYNLLSKKDSENKIFITDPWNYVAEGSFDQSGDKYLKVALSHMKTFSKRWKSHNIIVEHQNKPQLNAKGEAAKASVHNITGGAMWYKKCDSIILLHNYWTEDNQDTSVDFETAKSKAQRYNGQRGTRALYFDLATGRYLEQNPNVPTEQTTINYSEPLNSQVNASTESDLPF